MIYIIGLSLIVIFSAISFFNGWVDGENLPTAILLIIVASVLLTVSFIMVKDGINSYKIKRENKRLQRSINKKLPTQKEYDNFTQDELEQYSKDYYNGAFAHAGLSPDTPVQEEKPKFTFKHSLRYVYSIIGIVIVYGVINLVLYGGQELFHSGEKNRLKEMEIELSNAKQVIEAYESKVTDVQYQTMTTLYILIR